MADARRRVERRGTRAASAAFNCRSARSSKRRHFAEPPLGCAAQHGLLSGRFLRRPLRAIAAVECIVQRQPIVALPDSVLRALERFDRGLVLLRGITVGACGARGVDRALGPDPFRGWEAWRTRWKEKGNREAPQPARTMNDATFNLSISGARDE